ncbi:MAG: glycerophosphoryl diester phosphodiesterase membrane domain-containing protein [Patescibacteria group bacterium]|nr:glycerophosphoryl diester phosphodiesterase membrane domain-containing protein [Patescibacteria group bacterium]
MAATKNKTSKPHFSKKEAISFGFKLAKENIVFFIGLFVIVVFISLLSTAIQTSLASQQPFTGIIVYVLFWIVNIIISMGLIRISLELIDKKKPKFLDLFHTKSLVDFIFGTIIRSVITIIGFILLIIPGIIFSIRLQFVTYLIVDKGMPAVDAVKKSWKMTKGNTWNLFFFGILLCLINVLGVLLLLVGLFITVPLSMLATTFVYRKLLNVSK